MQRSLDRRFLIAKGGVAENLRLLAFVEGQEGVANARNVLFGKLAILLAQILAQRLIPLCQIHELHIAAPVDGFAVAYLPDIFRSPFVVNRT
jgi:hypothetical protein